MTPTEPRVPPAPTAPGADAQVADVDARLADVEDAIAALMRGEFEHRIPIGDDVDSVFDAVAMGLNMLAEEIHQTTVGKEYLESLVDAMGDGLLVLSREGKIEKANRAMLALTGQSEDELLGRPLDALFAPSREGRAGDEAWVFDGGPIDTHAALVHRDLGPIPVLLQTRPIRGKYGGLRSAIIIVRDLRLLRAKLALEADLEARAARAQLQQATKLAAVGQLAGGVAHELNNPLMAVVSFASFLLDDLASEAEPTREVIARWGGYAARIRSSAERCRDIVRGLLDFARPGTSERVAVDVRQLVARVVAIVENQVRVQGTTLRVVVEDGLVIDAEPNKIEQVVLNVMLNAAQALERHGEIRVSAERRRDTIRLCVADTGPGIPRESLARVFDPFFTTKPVGQGTGLGLAVSWGIMQDHGGSIEVESEPGEGSRFILVFPGAKGEGRDEGRA